MTRPLPMSSDKGLMVNMIKQTTVFTFTEAGEQLSQRVVASLKIECDSFQVWHRADQKASGGLKAAVQKAFDDSELLIFIGATGIAVRSIAPFLKDKYVDPAVLVLDDQGQFVISLLSGHAGGANAFASALAGALGATAVITTATDVRGKGSLDLLLKRLNIGLEPYREAILKVNAALVNGQEVLVWAEPRLVEGAGAVLHPLEDGFVQVLGDVGALSHHLHEAKQRHQEVFVVALYESTTCHEAVIALRRELEEASNVTLVTAIPRLWSLGTGCRKALDFNSYTQSFEAFLNRVDLRREAIVEMGSIELKAEEACIHALAGYLDVPVTFFSKETLEAYEDNYETSEWVKSVTGVGSVAQATAHHMSGTLCDYSYKGEGATFALGRKKP